MNNKMLHRGPLGRLTATMNSFPVLSISTCVLLLLQLQIFHALPAASSSSSLFSQNQREIPSRVPLASSTAFDPANSYRSYRPGARLEDSYRPYSGYYQSGPNPKESVASYYSSLSESFHPNSIYSRQSSTPTASAPSQQDIDKVLRYIEREIDFQQQQPKEFTKPLRQPLPVPTPPTTTDSKKPELETSSTKPLEPLPFDTNPPPFAPELDPQYERNQYGLGSLSLLDQAGPFW